jgi:hypothetical protein
VESAIRHSESAQHYQGPNVLLTIAASTVDAIVCAKVGITPVGRNLLVELAVREGLGPFLTDARKDLRLPKYGECSATGTKFVVVGDDATLVYVL